MASASPGGAYRPRRPERTVLYRVLSQHFERYLEVHDDRFARAHGPLRPGTREAVYRYLDCGIFECGVARVRCGDCGHDFFVAFSCKLRCLCPSCHQKREILWAEWVEGELLEEVPHRQVVFTIPKRLRPYFRYDRKLLGDLASCAWRALRLYFAACLDDPDPVPGAVGFLASSGELLNFHPHVHLLVTDGGFSPDGTFHPLAGFDSSLVERIFQGEVLRLLTDKELISQQVVDNLLSWRHSGFSVHGQTRVESCQDAARLGRYCIRCPLVLDRLEFDDDTGEVVYHARPGRAETARFGPYEFIAALLDHLPPPNQQLVRYWGYYSNVSRAKRRAARSADPEIGDLAGALEPAAPEELSHRRRARLTWARLLKKIYEIDPLLCPFCGAEMKIIAFITEHPTVCRILRHLNMPPQRPEPLAHSPPDELDLDIELLDIPA